MRLYEDKMDLSYAYRDNLLTLSNRDKVRECLNMYRTVGLCKNIIDLMSDFVSEGVSFEHEDAKQKQFWNEWSNQVNLFDRCERYANILLKAGFVVIRRSYGNVIIGNKKYKLPLKYTFINPLQVDLYGNLQSGDVVVVFNIPDTMGSNAPDEVQSELDKNLSDLIKKARKQNKDQVILSKETTWVDFYKKDDWETYPDPFIFAALPDLHFYEHMRKMDLAAMKGVINVIRIWKLGSVLPNGKVMKPNEKTISKIKDMVNQATGGGTVDIFWDSMIDLIDTYPPVDKILGSGKYEYVKNEILSDFGIPEILISGKGPGSYSNQYLGMKALIEKLEYIREKITKWIEYEVSLICKELHFVTKPIIVFEHLNLRDEATIGRLVLQLFDRGIISKESTLQYINENWDIERRKISIERKEEAEDSKLQSFGPFKNFDPRAKGFDHPDNGRPEGTEGVKQEVMRDTKPKGS